MKILKYKKEKNNQYKIYFEDDSFIVLFDDVIVNHALLLKKELSEKEIEALTSENDELASYYVSIRYLGVKMRSRKELEKYLLKKEFQKASIDKTIARLKNEGYLNDATYVKAFLHDALELSSDGPNKIKRKLKELGIDEVILNEVVNAVDYNIWKSKLDRLVEKKVKGNHKDTEKILKQKLQNYLLTQGYSYSMIADALENIKIEVNFDVLKKEYDKLKRKLERKYVASELNFQIKQKLFQKGYSSDEINKVEKNDN